MNDENALTQNEVRNFIAAWYQALDFHLPVDQIYKLLAEEGLEMKFPDGEVRDYTSFQKWYDRVINLFFDENHAVHPDSIQINIQGNGAVVNLVVGWQASWWEPPAAKSKRVSLDSTQRWTIRRSSRNSYGMEIVTYDAIVEPFKYAPGFARL